MVSARGPSLDEGGEGSPQAMSPLGGELFIFFFFLIKKCRKSRGVRESLPESAFQLAEGRDTRLGLSG